MKQAEVAGLFYPKHPAELRLVLDQLFSHATSQNNRIDLDQPYIRGLVVPHAGYMYSGQTAACGYRYLRNQHYDGIILLGPCHRTLLELGSVLRETGYQTPLGAVPLNGDLADRIVSLEPRLQYQRHAFVSEHSLDVHIPFIQTVFSSVPPILPVLVGTHQPELLRRLAAAIFQALDTNKQYVVIASSDLSHFHSADVAESVDHATLRAISRYSVVEWVQQMASGQIEACGFGPITVLMMLMTEWGVRHAQIIDYSHSGSVTGDLDRVVGYGAVGFY